MTWVAPPQREELKWVAVDFDGTLAESTWDAADPTAAPGEVILRNVDKLEELAEAGWKIVIHTARPWSDYEIVESWLNWYCLPYDKIVCGKLLAALYVDDRALHADYPSWIPV